MESVRVLSERRAGDQCAVALTVEDRSGERYQVIRVLAREDGAWRLGGGFEGPDRTLPGKPDPYVSLGAYPGSRFFAGGTVQSAEFDVARVRLVWDDGQVLEDQVENGVVLFLGSRESLDPATAEFLDHDRRLIGTHVIADRRARPARGAPSTRLRRAARDHLATTQRADSRRRGRWRHNRRCSIRRARV